MTTTATTTHSSNRVEWALPHVKGLRLLRVGVLGVVLFLSLVFASLTAGDIGDVPFVLGVTLFVLAGGLTCTGAFSRLRPWVMTLVPLLDIATYTLFDFIPGAEVVGALLVVPAMWLGLTLGRRGVALAGLTVGLVLIAPGVLTRGFPVEGWARAISITFLTTLAAGGIMVATEVWARQIRRLEKQREALQNASEVRGDFIALVSHELRTPLTSIVGYLDLVGDVEEPIPEEALLYLAAVSRNADRLLLLVTDLLAASALENTPMRLALTQVDICALARLSLDDVNQRAKEAGLTLACDLAPDIVIGADPTRLLQVLDNLLSNAIKFTPPGGRISVTVMRQGDGVDLVVRDTGVGIDEESLPHLATKFFRTQQATAAAIPGLGLGLMNTKAIIKAHHGTLTFTSREHQGTSVRAHLPTTHTAAPEPDTRPTHLAARELPPTAPGAPARTPMGYLRDLEIYGSRQTQQEWTFSSRQDRTRIADPDVQG